MSPSKRESRLRASSWVIALVTCFAPIAQVAADAHCSSQERSSDAAADASSMHDHHEHSSAGSTEEHSAASGYGHDHDHCACPCGIACTTGMALLPALPAVAIAAPERSPTPGMPPHILAIYPVPQRPPALSALIV
jgi:hypothetical protein